MNRDFIFTDQKADLEKELKKRAIELLDKCNMEVKETVYVMSDLPADKISEHASYLVNHKKELIDSKGHIELFTSINLSCHWNYLSPHLLDHLVNRLDCLQEMRGDMDSYNQTLSEFRVQTPLEVFRQIEVKHYDPKEDFLNIVANFKERVSKDMTLEDIEQFRRKYADHYNLYEFTLRLNSVTKGSFIVSFLVPESIVEILRVNIPEEMLKAFGVVRLKVAGSCIYNDSKPGACSSPRSMSAPVISPSTLTSAKDKELAQAQQQLREKVAQSCESFT